MRKLFFILLIVWTAAVLGQSKIRVRKEMEKAPQYSASSVDYLYGVKFFNKDLYKTLNASNHLNSNQPIDFIGVGLSSENVAIGTAKLAFQMNFNYILREHIKVRDTVDIRLTGTLNNFGIGRMFSSPKRVINFAVFAGFNVGYLKFKSRTLGNQVNPFFSPKLAGQFKLVIKKVAFSINADYDYDVTNPAWKRPLFGKQITSLPSFNQSGFSVAASIGYCF